MSTDVFHTAQAQVLNWLSTTPPDPQDHQHEHQRIPFPATPLLIGISGPQGSGKTTLATRLAESLGTTGPQALTVVTLSIDDFYLTKAEQDELARVEAGNPLLEFRGNPGTHDVALAIRTLDKLAAAHQRALSNDDSKRDVGSRDGVVESVDSGSTSVLVPRYDKGLHNGRGDRAPRNEWTLAVAPFHIIILEGWCVGFRPVSTQRLQHLLSSPPSSDINLALHAAIQSCHTHSHPLAHLARLNSAIGPYLPLWHRLNGLIHLHTTDLQNVYSWRKQQEYSLRATRGRGLTDEQVDDFVDRFMPGYLIGLDSLLGAEEAGTAGPVLRLVIGPQRELLHADLKT
ncbi:hypothetical protein HDU87_002667 [Geranomyces variabilis]|uniref:P-loop containing nucleoside triphosphate hydrolase protein n=1 Tax=Geranomyces variabilis TaxID=109894 RepID=A0AAD5TTS5_9FUNG|nr:hypothetical protein HDU87_002667 [Geranomyces variabilis]